MPVTFQVVGNLADFGNDPRAGVRVRVYATPGVKVGDVAVHSNVPEEAITDADGAFAVTLVSLPGVWYRIEPRYGEFRPVNLAGYIPDSVDPTTGEPLPDGTVINLRDVVDESPTPGYQAIAYVGGGEGGGTGDVTTAQLTAEANARIAGDAALDVRVDVLEAADVILEGDPRLTDPRTPAAHTHDDRYFTEAEVTTALAGKQAAGDYATNAALTTGLAGKAATSHGHVIADTTGLQAALDGKQAAGSYAAATHTHTASQVSDSTTVGRAVLTAADAAAARTAIGAGTGTSSFSGAYADLTGKPSLGTAAATASTDYATAAQGAKADTALQPTTGQTINAQTGTTYALVASDAGKVVTLSNTGAITLSVPAATFTAGQRVDCIVLNTGMVTVTAGTGAPTVNGTPSLVSRARYSAFTVLALTASSFVVIGDLA